MEIRPGELPSSLDTVSGRRREEGSDGVAKVFKEPAPPEVRRVPERRVLGFARALTRDDVDACGAQVFMVLQRHAESGLDEGLRAESAEPLTDHVRWELSRLASGVPDEVLPEKEVFLQ